LQAVVSSSDFLTAWTLQALYWVEVAFYFMGIWILVDTVALLLGVRLRQNFAHLLSNENPSDLWRSVRATMTYWLVYHVYRPLGGNQGWQGLHIVAALAVSVVWHLIGVPFLAIPAQLLHFAPFTLWAVITAAALVAHVHARRRGWRLLPASTPVVLRRGIHRLLTLLLASLAVTLPAFQIGDNVDLFVPFIRTLCGLAP
jgi:D-alanyl-lipoteichoic acid acyltransferase DltB (MBOAT superfamily)